MVIVPKYEDIPVLDYYYQVTTTLKSVHNNSNGQIVTFYWKWSSYSYLYIILIVQIVFAS